MGSRCAAADFGNQRAKPALLDKSMPPALSASASLPACPFVCHLALPCWPAGPAATVYGTVPAAWRRALPHLSDNAALRPVHGPPRAAGGRDDGALRLVCCCCVLAVRGLVRKLAHKKPQLLHKFFVPSAIKSVRRHVSCAKRMHLHPTPPPPDRCLRLSDIWMVAIALPLGAGAGCAASGQLDDHKADVKGANALLIKELYGALGDSMLASNPRLPVSPPPPFWLVRTPLLPLVLAPLHLHTHCARPCCCGQVCVANQGSW